MHLRFFKRSFAWSLAIPCGVLLLLALLQSGLLQVFSVGWVTQDALVAGGVQSCLLALLMPWVLFLRYQEFWGTRSFSSEEMRGMLWQLYFKVWLALVGSGLGLYFVLRTFGVSFSGFSPLWILSFSALSLYGSLWCVQNLTPDKRQWIYSFGVVVLGGLLGSLFSAWTELIGVMTLGLLCLGTWLLWRVFPVSETEFSADTDLSAFLFYPLFSGGQWLPKRWRRLAFMASSTYLSLLLLLCCFLPLALLIWSVFWGGNQWSENLSVLQDYLDPVYPWLLVALLLIQVQSAYFWQARREFWLTRPISRWQMQGVSVAVHFTLYFLTVGFGVLLCQLYTGYVFQGGFYALVLFFFLLGPSLAFVTLLQIGLNLGGFGGLTYLLIQGNGLGYLLWSIAGVGWVFMLTRSRFRTSTQWLTGIGVALLVNAVLFYGMQHSLVLQAAYPRYPSVRYYQQLSRIETYLSHLLWLDVPRHEPPFEVAQSVLMLDSQPQKAVSTLIKDTLHMLHDQDILEVSPDTFFALWVGRRAYAVERLQYWRRFAPSSQHWLAFEYALQEKPEQALAEARRAYQAEQSLEKGLQWAYLQQVFLQEKQALQTYQMLLRRHPESQSRSLFQLGHLLSRGCQPELAQQRYQQARQAGFSFSLTDIQNMRKSVWYCLDAPPPLKSLLSAQLLKRSLSHWSQFNVESQLRVARDALFDSQNNPEMLAFFKPLLQAEDFTALQETSQEIERLWRWSEAHGVMSPRLRRIYHLFPALFRGGILTDEEKRRYPHLLKTLGRY